MSTGESSLIGGKCRLLQFSIYMTEELFDMRSSDIHLVYYRA